MIKLPIIVLSILSWYLYNYEIQVVSIQILLELVRVYTVIVFVLYFCVFFLIFWVKRTCLSVCFQNSVFS